jgi:hypothetical protein
MNAVCTCTQHVAPKGPVARSHDRNGAKQTLLRRAGDNSISSVSSHGYTHPALPDMCP